MVSTVEFDRISTVVSEMESWECINGSNKFHENQLPENAESLHSLKNSVTSERELGYLPAESAESFPVDSSNDSTATEQDVCHGATIITEEILTCGTGKDTKRESGVENLDFENNNCPAKNDQVGDDEPLIAPAKYSSLETKIVFGSINPEEEVPALESDDVPVELKHSNGHIKCVCSQASFADCHIHGSLQDGGSADVEPESEVDSTCNKSSRDFGTNDATTVSENLDLSVRTSESALKSVIPGIVDVTIMGNQVNGCHVGAHNKPACKESERIGSIRIDEIPAGLAGSRSVVTVESASNPVLEIPVSDNSDQVDGGLTDDSVGVHVAEIPACFPGISVESALNSDLENAGVRNGVNIEVNEATDKKLICHETNGNVEEIHSDGIPPTSFPDVMDAEVAAVARSFRFLIKIPRLDDEKLKEQIRVAKLRVEDKTRLRDNIRMELQAKRTNCQALSDAYEVARSEERAARRLVRLKRLEIDDAQSVINKVKNAMSVEDIDNRIYNIEHMINHETLPLKEEKQFIREMKQLRHLKEQLSSNMGSMDEIQQAMDQKDEIEERLKILKKELDSLKVMVSKAGVKSAAAGKRCEEEGIMLRELQAQFRAADDIRQEEYASFLSLKRQAFEKNKHYWTFKDDVNASRDYASRGDLVRLHCACVNQVEKIMELWNKNDEFRREYVRCNMRSTVRRLRTLDGRSLGPDEEPSVMTSSYVNERKVVADDRLVSFKPDKVNSMSLVPTPLQQAKHVVVSPIESEVGGVGKSSSASVVLEQRDQRTVTTEKHVKSISSRGNGFAGAIVTSRDETLKEEGETEEENNSNNITLLLQQQQTKEEQEELAKKAAELKEQRRLEEKAKAQEALERKRRNAERAEIRAALKAQKEAEQKEKEREKRLKKKERKKTGISEGGQDEGESGVSEIKEVEMKEKSSSSGGTAGSAVIAGNGNNSKKNGPAVAASSSYFRKQSKLKSIPPPPAPMIKNRSGKRRMQQLMWVAFALLFLVGLFVFGSNSFFLSLERKTNSS